MAPAIKMEDYSDKVLKMIEEEANWATNIAKGIAKEEGIEFEQTKFVVNKTVKKPQGEGKIARKEVSLKNKEVLLCYRKDLAMSGLHRFLERQVTKIFDAKGEKYELAQPEEDKQDIMTKNFDIEIETGLKSGVKPFADRRTNITRKTYVIVPNQAKKEDTRRR